MYIYITVAVKSVCPFFVFGFLGGFQTKFIITYQKSSIILGKHWFRPLSNIGYIKTIYDIYPFLQKVVQNYHLSYFYFLSFIINHSYRDVPVFSPHILHGVFSVFSVFCSLLISTHDITLNKTITMTYIKTFTDTQIYIFGTLIIL